MARASLRPYLPGDAAGLADVFRTSIEILAEDDYSDAQREAWAAVSDDVEEFGKWLSGMLTLVVDSEDGPLGFAALEDNAAIALLYVRPDAARQGVATLLCDALEKLAEARGAELIATDASDTSQPFFEKRGYVAQSRKTILRNDEWLANTNMTKRLAGKPAGDKGK